jgi:hypothetical protein
VKEGGKRRFSKCLRKVAAAIVTSGTAATSLAYAWPSDKPTVVQPAALPELARQAGQAMLLHNSDDGRTLLYVEQSHGESLEEFNGVVDAKQIREQVTNRDTGTTFLLTESGLYVIRRPIAERDKERREDERRILYSGG